MRLFRSLRSRLLLGSVFWTAGLLMASHLIFLLVVRNLRIARVSVYVHAMIATAVILMGIGIVILGSGMAPFNRLRERMKNLREGRDRRVDGEYPSEVQPLVDDLNAMLAHREEVVRRALAKAGDLAHGLKTPLAVLSHEAERADAEGQAELAAAIRQQVERMRRSVEVHLAQARAAGSAATLGAQANVASVVESLSRVLLRLYADRHLGIAVDTPVEDQVRCQREDLEEMLGNLLDNACKWAKSRVRVSSVADRGSVAIFVEDDGAGLAPAMREKVMQRGVRADEEAPGSGLGLAIVRDVAELYGGSIALSESPMGGVRAELRLPSS
jgi:signal transduction histidine kinase